ncbi:hypothetical protein HYH02_006224 [Chlamydomonas schloesseri]|uniref:Translin-associated factor X-interacting protein 1 N-terminal domain-containing protein n=1 Tax=Chlamydomonas schloesseri TaxID=2026947 RepID=A0A835WLA7_9CHLO|nr:hypothetical protein HYH02_006224 [Chlamydomonas schloesseri]|eukprot:KAG2448875.1 hypothetical protein HYH02_006224 [Chlamydomonas schloesseri]
MDVPSTSALQGSASPRNVGSPSSRVRANLQESISASKLYKDLSPARVYQNSSDESRVTLPELFRQKNGLQSLRPTYSNEPVGGEDDDAGRTPKLLQRLEALLEEKLGLVERLGNGNKGFAAAQLRTDAFRQVFDAFLHSFTTYRSLLLRIKQEYDVALDDALASLYDNVHMKAELAVVDERMATAVQQARARAMEDASAVRKELQDQLNMEESKALQAEARCQAAEQEIQACKSTIQTLKREVAELQKANTEIKNQLLLNSSWGGGAAAPKADTA